MIILEISSCLAWRLSTLYYDAHAEDCSRQPTLPVGTGAESADRDRKIEHVGVTLTNTSQRRPQALCVISVGSALTPQGSPRVAAVPCGLKHFEVLGSEGLPGLQPWREIDSASVMELWGE